jgi:hypothetical protein
VGSPKTKRLLFMEGNDGCDFIWLGYDFCLLNWIRVDFTPYIQINK